MDYVDESKHRSCLVGIKDTHLLLCVHQYQLKSVPS